MQLYAQDPRDFMHDIAVNFHGPYYLMRLLLPHFRAQRSGCVLNIASRAGTVTIPYSTSYCASKAALINLTACAQCEMDVEGLEDVHLYSLHPGGIKSAMTLKSVFLLPVPHPPTLLGTRKGQPKKF
jgi:NAD(P)-dependent dehydrogenase (short-subunit alcohol dehydrogenase family)